MDRVEESRETVDFVELARERRRQIEPKAVDVAVDDEVAERIHDQPQHRGVHRVQRVPGPGEVHVEARLVRHQAVVARVVDALERQHRPEVVPLGGVVVDDVEDHLDSGTVQRLDHALELTHLLAVRAGRRVERVWREIADRGVSPVVRQSTPVEEALVRDVVHRQQLDGGHAERLEVLERRLRREPGIRAANVLAHIRMTLRESLDVHLVDRDLVPRMLGRPVVLPVEPGIDDDALGDGAHIVLPVHVQVRVVCTARDIGEDIPGVPVDRPLDRLRVGIDQQLVRVEAVAGDRVVRAVDTVPVPLAGADTRDVAVPVERFALALLDARLVVLRVEETELDALGVLGEEREVRTVSVPRRAERERLAGPDLHRQRTSTRFARKSATRCASPRRR